MQLASPDLTFSAEQSQLQPSQPKTIVNIYITRNGQQLGPYTLEQIQSRVNSGALLPVDLAWCEGMATWAPLSDVPGYPGGAPTFPMESLPPLPKPKPALAWVISLFYFISAPFTILYIPLLRLLSSAAIPLPEVQRQYFQSQTVVDYSLIGLTAALNLAGAIFLFKLRHQALYFFGSVVVVTILNFVYQIAYKNWIAVMGSASGGLLGAVMGILFGVSISIAIFIYVWRLQAAKILR